MIVVENLTTLCRDENRMAPEC